MKPKRRRKQLFENSGIYFFGLFLLAIAGFWPSYFAKLFDGTADFSFYFHFHTVIVTSWVFMLISQPLLIRLNNNKLHRFVGTASYFLVPLIYISVLLLKHSLITGKEENLGIILWIPLKDLLLFSVGYSIAIRYRKNVALHARGMIVTGIVFIEPALVRLINNLSIAFPKFISNGYLLTIFLIYGLIISLIIVERKHKKGRWIFPLTLMLYIFVHAVIIFKINSPLQKFAEWFSHLPLT